MLASLEIINSFGSWRIDERCIQHYMSAFPTFNLTITSSKMPTFMVALLGILFSRLIFISTENKWTVYVSLSLFKWNLNLNLHTRNIANIYVIIWYIYSPSDELNKGVSNTQHKMLPFHKEINASWKSFFFREYCQHLCHYLW